MLINNDYIVIVAFFILMISAGFLLKKYNKSGSDYLRNADRMVWQSLLVLWPTKELQEDLNTKNQICQLQDCQMVTYGIGQFIKR